MHTRQLTLIGLALFGAFFGGYYAHRQPADPADHSDQSVSLRAHDNAYAFINPLLACTEKEYSDFRELTRLKTTVQQAITDAREKHEIAEASVYFRDPIKGLWMGINENTLHAPASLLKVPLMMAYFKIAERNPAILQKKIVYRKNPANTNALIDRPLLASGATYTAEELIRGMIIDSDNDAKEILQKSIDPALLSEAYSDLGIVSPYTGRGNDEYEISAKTYALFFRVLYNATFLNREMSEKALQLLAGARFPKGLRAGIPKDIPIAHKYGVRVSDDPKEPGIELSDCGIIYDTPRPYLLCVMTKGSNAEALADFIEKIGSTAHAAIQSPD